MIWSEALGRAVRYGGEDLVKAAGGKGLMDEDWSIALAKEARKP